VALTAPLPPALFNPGLSGNPEVAGKLRYDAATGLLSFIGPMSATELAFLLNPARVVLDASGQPVLDASGQPVTTPLALTAQQQAAIQQLYTASQTATLGDQGLAVADRAGSASARGTWISEFPAAFPCSRPIPPWPPSRLTERLFWLTPRATWNDVIKNRQRRFGRGNSN